MSWIFSLKETLLLSVDKSIFDTIENNIFDNAKSVNYKYALLLNLFEHYTELFNTAKQIDKYKLIIVILRTTAKILAYDFGLLGY
ncbi:MAG: GT-D fold domain-containing glycosyltransferase [Candidatus Malihini olakiniferum]